MAVLQDNTLADRPMVELLTMLMHMLDMARHSAQHSGGSPALHQLVLILADGRFHEKESLRRVVEVPCQIYALPNYRPQLCALGLRRVFLSKAACGICCAKQLLAVPPVITPEGLWTWSWMLLGVVQG